MKSSRKKIVLCVVAVIVLISIVYLAVYLKSVSNYKQAVNNIHFENIDITNIADGSYIGECDVNFIYAKVEVTVCEGRITSIKILEHKNDRGQAAEKIIDDIVREQKINLDAVTGATNSSIVLKKAVENALTK